MMQQAKELRTAFVDAYEPFVRDAIVALGASYDDSIEQAVLEGREWLDEALEDLAGLSFDEQRRGPLELFQESMRFPTAALHRAGLEPVDRDEVVANALPGDHFGLAPAASHELGEAAWHAHLAWGAAKVAGMPRPDRVGVLSNNLMDRSKLDSALERGGYQPVVVRDSFPDELVLVLIDLDHPSAHEIIRESVDAGVECVAFGPHGDTEAMAAATALGANRAIPRSRVLRDPAGFVANL